MGQPITVPPPGFDEMSVEDQIEYVQALWERIAISPERVPVSDWHVKVIDDRIADLESNPDDVVAWEEVQGEADAKLRRGR